jgi:anti-sigma regulatory factor (Ser/Thr protein kinase)
VLANAWHNWEEFVDSDHQHDDACLALILTKPPGVLEMSSSARNCKFAREFIEQWSLAAGFPDLERGRIVLAADEAVTNIIRHTYNNAEDQPIILSAAIADNMLHFHLRDYGPPVDPVVLKGRDLDDIRPGGLGLHLLQSVFNVVEHTPLEDGNEWRLVKQME